MVAGKEMYLGERAQRRKALRIAVIGRKQGPAMRIRDALRAKSGFKWLDTHPSTTGALANIGIAQPDVILIELEADRIPRLELVRQVRSITQNGEIIVAAALFKPEEVIQAFMLGASGLLLDSSTAAECATVIHDVASGNCALSQQVVQMFFKSFQRTHSGRNGNSLTAREQQIIAQFTLGNGDKEIAARLEVEIGTVHTHTNSIFRKLGVNSRAEAVQKYFRPRVK